MVSLFAADMVSLFAADMVSLFAADMVSLFGSAMVSDRTFQISNASFGPRARICQRDEVEVYIGRRSRADSRAQHRRWSVVPFCCSR